MFVASPSHCINNPNCLLIPFLYSCTPEPYCLLVMSQSIYRPRFHFVLCQNVDLLLPTISQPVIRKIPEAFFCFYSEFSLALLIVCLSYCLYGMFLFGFWVQSNPFVLFAESPWYWPLDCFWISLAFCPCTVIPLIYWLLSNFGIKEFEQNLGLQRRNLALTVIRSDSDERNFYHGKENTTEQQAACCVGRRQKNKRAPF